MNLSTQYRMEPFTLDHFPAMQLLFKEAFHVVLDEKSFIKRFDTKALGEAVVGFVAFDIATGDAAAYYGVFPVKAIVKNRLVLVAQSGDTMTHPAHRRKGLFTYLATLTFAVCKEKDIKFIFGQPNAFSAHGLINSLGFTPTDVIVQWDLKLSFKTIPLPKLLSKSKKLGNHYFGFAKKVLKTWIIDEPEDFSNPLPHNSGHILRDKNYLQYKKDYQKFFIKINGVVLWIKLTDVLWIGDFSDYEKVDKRLMNRLKKLAFLLGFNTIRFQINGKIEAPKFLSFFKKAGEESSCFLYLNEQHRNTNLTITAADFDTW